LEGMSWSHDESMSEYHEVTQKTIETRRQRQPEMPDPIAVAEKIFEAANDESDRLRYLVGDDAESYFAKRKEVGAEEYVKDIYQNFIK